MATGCLQRSKRRVSEVRGLEIQDPKLDFIESFENLFLELLWIIKAPVLGNTLLEEKGIKTVKKHQQQYPIDRSSRQVTLVVQGQRNYKGFFWKDPSMTEGTEKLFGTGQTGRMVW